MIEEVMPPEDIKMGDEVRITIKGTYGWHKVTRIEPGAIRRAHFGSETRALVAVLYKVRRQS